MLSTDGRWGGLYRVPMGHDDRRGPGKPAKDGNQARWAREALGLSSRQALDRIEAAGYAVTESGLSRLETKPRVAAHWIERLSTAYGIPAAVFLQKTRLEVNSLILGADIRRPAKRETPVRDQLLRSAIQELMRKFGKPKVVSVALDEATEEEAEISPPGGPFRLRYFVLGRQISVDEYMPAWQGAPVQSNEAAMFYRYAVE